MRVYVGEFADRPLVDRDNRFDTIHPKDFKDVVSKIRTETPHHEFWTNNPYVLDACKPDEVFVFRYDLVQCITKHPEWEKYKNQFTPGEFWSIIGEDWIRI